MVFYKRWIKINRDTNLMLFSMEPKKNDDNNP